MEKISHLLQQERKRRGISLQEIEVELTLDGQDLPPLGKSGQVIRNIRLPAQG